MCGKAISLILDLPYSRSPWHAQSTDPEIMVQGLASLVSQQLEQAHITNAGVQFRVLVRGLDFSGFTVWQFLEHLLVVFSFWTLLCGNFPSFLFRVFCVPPSFFPSFTGEGYQPMNKSTNECKFNSPN